MIEAPQAWTKTDEGHGMTKHTGGDPRVCQYTITRYSARDWAASAREGYYTAATYRSLGIHKTLKAARAAVAEHAASFIPE